MGNTREQMSKDGLVKVMALKDAGKTQNEIVAETGYGLSTVAKYTQAVDRMRAGKPQAGNDYHCRTKLVEEFVKNERKGVEVMNERNVITVETTQAIMRELQLKTPVSVLSRLLKVDADAINRVQAYSKLLMDRENDKAIAYKAGCGFTPEVFSCIEKVIGFSPKVKTKEEKEMDFQKDILSNLETISAYLDSIHDLGKEIKTTQVTVEALTEMLKLLQGNVLEMTRAIQEMKKGNAELNQSVRLLVNSNLNQRK